MDFMYANKMGVSRSETDVFVNFIMRVPTLNNKGEIDGERDVDRRDVIITVDAAKVLRDMLTEILNSEKPEG